MKQRLCAFTLVEILVVLGIITLLAALLFTVFSRVREGGRRTVCVSNQKQILLALQMYQEDAAGHFPFRNPLDIHSLVWIDALLPHVKTAQVFVCPSDVDIENTRTYGFLTVVADGSKHPTIPASYIASEELLWNRDKGKIIRPRALAEVIHPVSTVFLSDGAKEASLTPPYWTNKVVSSSSFANSLAGLGYILRDPFGSHDDNSYTESFAPNPRHNGRAIVGFVDGHVKSMDLSQWYFPNTPYLDPARGG